MTRLFFYLALVFSAIQAQALDILGTAKAGPPVEIRVCKENCVLLSRGSTPLAVFALRSEDAAITPPLTRVEARAILQDASILKVAENSEQLAQYRQRYDAQTLSVDALLRVARISAGARVLVAGEQADGARAVSVLYFFADSLDRSPALTYLDGQRVPTRPFIEVKKEGEPLRARTIVFETTPQIDSLNPKQQVQDTEKDIRVHIARTAAADWTARAADGGVLLTAPLRAHPRNPREVGSFILYMGTDLDAGRAELSPIRLNKKETPARDFLEGAVRVYASGANPYSLTELAVVAEIAQPPSANGEVEVKRLPCFFWEAPSANPAEGEFRFRYAPPKEGLYGVRISIATAMGQLKTDAVSFRAGPPASAGFVRIDKKLGTLRYDDGSAFLPQPFDCKEAAANTVESLRNDFKAMNRAGKNCARLNLAFGPLRIEGPKLGLFDPNAAARLDEILLAAQARDIHLVLAIEDALAVSTESPNHPYFREMGGPLSATPEFFRNPQAKRAFQSRMAYIAARFGAYRSVLGWDVLREIETSWHPLKNELSDVRLTPEESDLARRARRDVQDWLNDAGLSMRGMDGHGHPVTVSTGLDLEKMWTDLKKVESIDHWSVRFNK